MMFVMINHSKQKTAKGFSLIELSIVFIVATVLVITAIVSFKGVTKKAAISDIQSELTKVSSLIMADKLADGSFPLTLKSANKGKGIISSLGVKYQYEVNNTTIPKTFCITATKDSTNYKVTNGSTPTAGTCLGFGAALYLDAGNSLSYAGSGSKWQDMSKNEYSGALLNGVGYNKQNIGVLTFDGIDDYIEADVADTFISNPTLNNYKLSFSFWVNVTSSNSYYIISSGSQTASTGIAFSYQAGGPFYSIRGADKAVSSSVGNFPLDTWINWTVTSDGSNSFLYKNGELQSSTAFTSGGSESKYSDLTIGTPNNSKGNYMTNMKFASLIIYDRTLTPVEVQQNFDSGRSRYGI